MPNGIVENEYCPVFQVVVHHEPTPAAGEVAETRWIPWTRFVEQVEAGVLEVSPWQRSSQV